MLWLGAIVLVVLPLAFLDRTEPPRTSVLALVVALAVWMFATNRWANVSYTPAATYQAIFLVLGYLLGRRGAFRAALPAAAVFFGLSLAAWAFWQRIESPRANAFFETPATLAAVLNLVLVPTLVVTLARDRNRAAVGAVAILLSALLLSTSRGGWVAFGVASVFAVVMLLRARVYPQRLGVGTVAIAVAAGIGTVALFAIRSGPASFELSNLGSVTARLGLYELALHAMTPQTLLVGQGYLSFYYVLEAGKAAVADYASGMTYFVHNDYLQTLLEIGLPGLILLLGIVTAPLVAAWRALPRLSASDRVPVIALSAALASMAVHALVDYPFYVPVCVLMYAGVLGMLDGRLAAAGAAPVLPLPGRGWRVAGAALVAFAVWFAALPVAAEVAAATANRAWRVGEGQRAAHWFDLARRIEPQDWRYHWYVGQFWLAQAMQSRRPEAAELADKAFSDGVRANPREVRNLTGRIETQLLFGQSLASGLDRRDLIAMAEHALELAPGDRAARQLHDRLRSR